jgi:hypothetical protein
VLLNGASAATAIFKPAVNSLATNQVNSFNVGDPVPPNAEVLNADALARGDLCAPVCEQGQYWHTDALDPTDILGQRLAPACKNCPVGRYCPAFMTYGCAGSSEQDACLLCAVNAESAPNNSPKATRCVCKTGFVDLLGAADGSGCTPEAAAARR